MSQSELSPLAYRLYGRQMILPELGQVGQDKLSQSHVAVIGAGGLGSPALLYLAGAGIGRITVLDDDVVEVSNLHRQVIHSYARVGSSKADSAAQTLRELNPLVQVNSLKVRLTDQNAADLLADIDVLVDGSDNFATRYTASRAAACLGIPHVWGAILGFDAQMSVFWAGRGPRYEDLYPVEPAPGSVPNCATAGVIGALAGVVGTAMALETIKLTAGIGQPLLGEVGYYSGLTGRWEYIPLLASEKQGGARQEQARPACPPPQTARVKGTESPHADQFGPDITLEDYRTSPYLKGAPLLDVREPYEHKVLAIPGTHNLPLSLIEQAASAGTLEQLAQPFLPHTEDPCVLYCATGLRSRTALQRLAEAGYHHLYSLQGGITAWLEQQ